MIAQTELTVRLVAVDYRGKITDRDKRKDECDDSSNLKFPGKERLVVHQGSGVERKRISGREAISSGEQMKLPVGLHPLPLHTLKARLELELA